MVKKSDEATVMLLELKRIADALEELVRVQREPRMTRREKAFQAYMRDDREGRAA